MNFMIVNSLIGMYIKYVRIHKPQKIFKKMHDAIIVSWNEIFAGYEHNGFSQNL